jgi:phosphosulfolactate synthase
MYNFDLSHLPERAEKPRTSGVNMIMDKGLSIREAEDMIQVSGHLIDFVKLGFGTSIATGRLEDKIAVYKNAGISIYFGGTLFEAFLIRSKTDEYRRLLDRFGVDTVEISDGSMDMDHEAKCNYIRSFARDYRVLSEVGSKRADVIISDKDWVSQMVAEQNAGSLFIIAEAREAGNIGIYDASGSAKKGLINLISAAMPVEKILWEAPQKNQQLYFIKEFGANVNLGNIAPNDVIPLETIRLGLRGDTFFHFLPDSLKQFDQK